MQVAAHNRKHGSPKSPHRNSVGVIGMGQMGAGIAVCLLTAGHPVTAVETDDGARATARRRVLAMLRESQRNGLLRRDATQLIRRLEVSADYTALGNIDVVVESNLENAEMRGRILGSVEAVVSPKTLIARRTAEVPATELQQGAQHPERIVGMHWAKPPHINRFMEIVCGAHTKSAYAQQAMVLAVGWGKEPSLVRRDVRGFLTNRLFYALLREAFYLVESGYATPADVDRSFRNDFGYWTTFAGPFRIMDLLGVPLFHEGLRDLVGDLYSGHSVPRLLEQAVESGAHGISAGKGFYRYTPKAAKRWEKLFTKFSYEIRALAQKYPEDAGDRTGARASRRA